MTIEITPYVKFDGIPTFRDSNIRLLYRAMDKQGFADRVFYDGVVSNSDKFLKHMQPPTRLFVAEEKNVTLGIGWLNGFEGSCARAHFCVFDAGQEVGAVKVGKELLGAAFKYGYEMFIGYVPESNQRAIAFAKKCGAVLLGVLPASSYIAKEHKTVGTAVLYYLKGENNG